MNRNSNHQKFKTLNEFPLINGKQSMYVMDCKKAIIHYTKGIQEMLGYGPDEFNMNVTWNIIHPDDRKIVRRVINANIDYCLTTSTLSPHHYLSITFRALKKDGSYIKVLQQSSPYQRDSDGKFTSNLTFLTDISFTKPNDSKVEWSIFSDDMDFPEFKEDIYNEFLDFFTPREMDIIQSIKNELTNKQIASKLFISAHTVVAHRKKIYKKSNSHNSKQLLEFCDRNGII